MSAQEPKPIIRPLGAVYDQSRDVGWLLVRLTAGGFLLIHGLQKLTGTTIAAFAANSLARRGIEPALPLAYLVYFMETIGALGIMLGLFTRLFAAMAVVHFIIIIAFAQWATGFPWNRPGGGWEYPAFWAIALVVQALIGDGAFAFTRTESPRLARA